MSRCLDRSYIASQGLTKYILLCLSYATLYPVRGDVGTLEKGLT